MTDRENQDTTTATAVSTARALTAFTRQRRLTAAMALSVGVGSLVYGTVLAFPAAASSTTTASVSCSTATASASASASGTKTDTGTATATASASASSTDSASASASPSASGSGTASASPSASATKSASASATPTDCATKTATASATPTATKTHTATATPTVKKSATAKASVTATISGKGNPPLAIDDTTTATTPWTIPVYSYAPTGEYFAYNDVPPGDASYQLPHGSITRAQIIARAQLWVKEQVPYSQTEWYTNANGTYRQDCSGFVSMAWDLDQYTDFWTGNLNLVSHTIPAAELLPGDNLMSDEHTVLFAGWANSTHTEFDYYEEAHPGTVARYVVDAPLSAFLDNGFAAFRYDGVVNSAALPASPVSGDLYSTLAQKASEIHPPGVIYGELLGLDQSGSASASATSSTTQISAQVAADDVVSSEGARSEGVVLGVGGAFLMGAGLLLRRPSIPLRGRRGRRGKH